MLLMDAVVVKNLSYQYQPRGPYVLKDINLEVKPGELAVITGLSGCGKSSLCLCLSGAIRHQRYGVMSGEVSLNGQNIEDIKGGQLALHVGIVFQDPDTQLFSPTVEDEIAFAPENLCLPPPQIRQRVDYVIDLLGIAALRYAHPEQLSGGQKQLVALAAVLALDPPLLILDEAMSQLDSNDKKIVADTLEKLREAGKTIIAVEHNLEDLSFADRLLVMEAGQIIRFDRMEAILEDREFLLERRLIYI